MFTVQRFILSSFFVIFCISFRVVDKAGYLSAFYLNVKSSYRTVSYRTCDGVGMSRKTEHVLAEGLMRSGQQRNDVSPQRPLGRRVQQLGNVLHQVVHISVTQTTLYAHKRPSRRTRNRCNAYVYQFTRADLTIFTFFAGRYYA